MRPYTLHKSGAHPAQSGGSMHTAHVGALAVLVSLGMAFAPGVAIAEPSDSGSSSDGSASGDSQASSAHTPSGNEPSDAGAGASDPDGNDPGGPPTSKLGSQPDDTSAEDTSAADDAELRKELAEIDAEEADSRALKDQMDKDPDADPEVVSEIDSEADLLVSEQQLVHTLADEQGITAPKTPANPAPVGTAIAAPRTAATPTAAPTATPTAPPTAPPSAVPAPARPAPVPSPSAPPASWQTAAPLAVERPDQYQGQSLDAIMQMIQTDRANMLDGQARAQAAVMKERQDKLAELNAKYDNPDLTQNERAAIFNEIEKLSSTSQLEMTKLQDIMNEFNRTTQGLSNWIAKDAQSKNTITGNLR